MRYAVIDHLTNIRISRHSTYALARSKATRMHDKQTYETAFANRYEVVPDDAEAEALESKIAANHVRNS